MVAGAFFLRKQPPGNAPGICQCLELFFIIDRIQVIRSGQDQNILQADIPIVVRKAYHARSTTGFMAVLTGGDIACEIGSSDIKLSNTRAVVGMY